MDPPLPTSPLNSSTELAMPIIDSEKTLLPLVAVFLPSFRLRASIRFRDSDLEAVVAFEVAFYSLSCF